MQVTRDDVGFRVSTPNSRVVDLGTRFRVSVSTEGRTRVRLDAGEVIVLPWQVGHKYPRHDLQTSTYDEAVVAGRSDRPGLMGSYRSGPSGFVGSISLGTSSLTLGSVERFDHVYKAVESSYRNDPDQTRVVLQQIDKIMERVSGTAEFGDKKLAFEGLDGLMQLEQLMAQMQEASEFWTRKAESPRVWWSWLVVGISFKPEDSTRNFGNACLNR